MSCANPCTLSVSSPVVTPPLACASVEASGQDCNCSVLFAIANSGACSSAVTAENFTFELCWGVGPSRSDCTSVEPGERGSLQPPLDQVGKRDFSYEVSDDTGTHSIRFTSEVTKLGDDDGCDCRVPAAKGSEPSALLPLALFGAGLSLLRRTRHRAS